MMKLLKFLNGSVKLIRVVVREMGFDFLVAFADGKLEAHELDHLSEKLSSIVVRHFTGADG